MFPYEEVCRQYLSEQSGIKEKYVRTANACFHGCYQAPQSERVFMNAQSVAGNSR